MIHETRRLDRSPDSTIIILISPAEPYINYQQPVGTGLSELTPQQLAQIEQSCIAIQQGMVERDFEGNWRSQPCQPQAQAVRLPRQDHAVGTKNQTLAARMFSGSTDEFPELRMDRRLATFQLQLKPT